MPKDIYLLMRPELVKATLRGQKWQTRRICKLRGILPEFVGQPGEESQAIYWEFPGLGLGPEAEEPVDMDWLIENPHTGPYGKPGDLVVVRESIGAVDEYPVLRAEGEKYRFPMGNLTDPDTLAYWRKYVAYKIDHDKAPEYLVEGWRSPMFMPRWAARIVRPITEIRVERVQEISESDAIAEGVDFWRHSLDNKALAKMFVLAGSLGTGGLTTGPLLYRLLWNEINLAPKPRYGKVGGKKIVTSYEAFPWSEHDFDALYPGARTACNYKGKPLTVYANPWVWVVGFERRGEAS